MRRNEVNKNEEKEDYSGCYGGGGYGSGIAAGCSSSRQCWAKGSQRRRWTSLRPSPWDYSNEYCSKTMSDAFTAKHPNITVELVELPDSTTNTAITQLAAKSILDVVSSQRNTRPQAGQHRNRDVHADRSMGKPTPSERYAYPVLGPACVQQTSVQKKQKKEKETK